MKSVEDLDVFKLAHEVTLEIYSLTNNFPVDFTNKKSLNVYTNELNGG